MIRATAVVPTKNEAHNIRPFLESLPAHLPLVVVDSSDDGTAELVLRHRPRRTTVVREDVGIAEARQIGAEVADTDWLLFTDADVVFPDDYLDRLFGVPDGAQLGGIIGTKLSRAGYERYHQWFVRGQRLASMVGIPAATGSNMLIRRDALADCGGFDLDLTVNEDSEVMWRVRRAGYRVRFCRDLVVYATDHRRLERGPGRKLAHSVGRCTLLYLGLMPRRLRGADWGYWT